MVCVEAFILVQPLSTPTLESANVIYFRHHGECIPSLQLFPKAKNRWQQICLGLQQGDDDIKNDRIQETPATALSTATNKSLEKKRPSHQYQRPILFSLAMIISGALLGPFLDSYHSAFGVLQYDEPFQLILWGSTRYPALTTTWWVPPLFGLAGFLIGWMYILLDQWLLGNANQQASASTMSQPASKLQNPSVTKILIGISFFTAQYWLSGVLYSSGALDRTAILNIMSTLAAVGFVWLDGTLSGFITSTATAVGGPLIEMGLISQLPNLFGAGSAYHYTDLGETGYFPLWIAPIYFLGGPAVGNSARGISAALSATTSNNDNIQTARKSSQNAPCRVCQDTRCVPCPNCEGQGEYTALGNRIVTCTSCRGRGFVICRACFQNYDEDPMDIDAIREKMSRMPD